jgi:metal-responsive CopG/Arc/MetJ family transcriptional regulator
MRTIVDLPEEQILALKHFSEKTRLSRAELLRRAVAEYLERHQSLSDDDAFGCWRHHERDGLEYQRQVRQEWDK